MPPPVEGDSNDQPFPQSLAATRPEAFESIFRSDAVFHRERGCGV